METYEALIIALVVLLIVFVAYRAMNNKKGKDKYVDAAVDLGEQRAANLAALAAASARRSGDVAPSAPDFRTRNGHYIDPARLGEAEQQAWTPSNPYAAPNYDPTRDVMPGDSLAQTLGKMQEGDWSQRLADFAVDAQTRANHRDWADNVGPFSQTAMAVDDLDEQVALGAQPRHGITAFRPLAVSQGPCTLQITEVGPADHVEHFRRFDF